MKNLLKWFLIAITVIISCLLIFAIYNNRNPHPGYTMDLSVQTGQTAQNFSVGFGKRVITPTITDTWNDDNGNARYDKEETYNDHNGNGRFDAVWIAGFHNNRPANGVHDDVWSRAIVLDDGTSRIALVSLDAIGFMYPDVSTSEKLFLQNWGLIMFLFHLPIPMKAMILLEYWVPELF